MNHALIPELAAYKQWRTTAHTLLLELRRNIADPTPVSLEALSW